MSRLAKLALLSLAFAFAAPSQAQSTGRLEVIVTNRDDTRGLDASIAARGADTVVVRAGVDGRASLALRGGAYTITVRSLGHLATTRDVAVRTGETSVLRIALEPTALPLGAMVVTASRREQRLADAPIAVEIITANDLAVTGASDLASALVEQTGIELVAGSPTGAGVMVQGIGSERVLILLNGQPIAGRIGGTFDLARIPVSVIERVEVVKGPQSTLYGSEAMGGVINIITRRGGVAGISTRASVRGGTQERYEGSAGADFTSGRFASSADIGRRSIEATPGRAQLGGAMTARLDGALSARWTASPTDVIDATILAIDERQRWRSGSLYQIGDNRQLVARLSGEVQLGPTRLVPSIGYSSLDHVLHSSALELPIRGDTGQRQQQQLALAGITSSTPFGRHRLDGGVEAKWEGLRAERVSGTRRSLTTLEPFSQLELSLGDGITLVPGARLSWNEQWGTNFTPRLAARVAVTPALTLRLSAAGGYRAPDFKELYLDFQNEGAQYAVRGNSALRPEHSRNLSGGIEWAADRLYARGTLFHNRLRDFIETRVISSPSEPLLYRYENVVEGTTSGGEVQSGAVFGAARVEVGYSHLRTHDESTGLPLLGRPRHSARLTATLPMRFGHLTATELFTDRTPMTRDAATGAVTGWRDAFVRTNVRFALPEWRGVETALGVDNLFDRQPGLWAAPTARQFHLTLSWAASSGSR